MISSLSGDAPSLMYFDFDLWVTLGGTESQYKSLCEERGVSVALQVLIAAVESLMMRDKSSIKFMPFELMDFMHTRFCD